jgi:hypothetical protein
VALCCRARVSASRHAASPTACRCPNGPEPLRPCRAVSHGAAPRPLPLRSFSCPTRHQAGPPSALFLPTASLSRHKKVSPDAIPHLACFPLASTGAPRLLPHFLPLDAPSTDGGREALDLTGPHRFLPELRHRPASSVSVSRSFDLSQSTAPYSLPSSSMLRGYAPTICDHRASSITVERSRPSSTPPPHRCATSPVRPRHPHVVRQVPRSAPMLQPLEPLHLAPRWATNDRAAPDAPCAVTRAGARSARRAIELAGSGWLRGRASGHEAVMAPCRSRPPHPIGLRPRAGFSSVLSPGFLNHFSIVLIHRNCVKFQNS